MTLLDDYYACRKRRDQETVFTPYETELRIEARLRDTEYIDRPNTLGLYEFTFDMLDSIDYIKVENYVDELLSAWDRKKGRQIGPNEWETATNKVFNDQGSCIVSQYFAPKLPPSVDGHVRPDDPYFAQKLSGETVSLTLFFKDDPGGNLYCQCSFVDAYERDEECVDLGPVEDDDF